MTNSQFKALERESDKQRKKLKAFFDRIDPIALAARRAETQKLIELSCPVVYPEPDLTNDL